MACRNEKLSPLCGMMIREGRPRRPIVFGSGVGNFSQSNGTILILARRDENTLFSRVPDLACQFLCNCGDAVLQGTQSRKWMRLKR